MVWIVRSVIGIFIPNVTWVFNEFIKGKISLSFKFSKTKVLNLVAETITIFEKESILSHSTTHHSISSMIDFSVPLSFKLDWGVDISISIIIIDIFSFDIIVFTNFRTNISFPFMIILSTIDISLPIFERTIKCFFVGFSICTSVGSIQLIQILRSFRLLLIPFVVMNHHFSHRKSSAKSCTFDWRTRRFE